MPYASSSATDWQPDPVLLIRLRSGVNAEKLLEKSFLPWVETVLIDNHKIPTAAARKVAERTLTATINSVRENRDWKPGLGRQMAIDQAFVYWIAQRGRPDQARLDRCLGVVNRYIQSYMNRMEMGHDVAFRQRVEEETNKRFIDSLLKDGFVLTSALDTLLIGIIRNVIKEAERANDDPFSRQKKRAQDGQPAFISLETIQYFQEAHQLIDAELVNMRTNHPTCHAIILEHYNIDPNSLTSAPQKPNVDEPLTDAEFLERFNVALQEPNLTGTLKELAPQIGISIKKISNHHRNCLDRLVRAVVPELVNTVDLPNWLRPVLEDRLETARWRHINQ